MKHSKTVIIASALSCAFIFSCKNNTSNTAITSEAEVAASSSEVVEKATPKAETPSKVYNVNLATAEDLEQLALSKDVIETILKSRPFLTMMDFDTALGTLSTKTALYENLFVPLNLNTSAEDNFIMIPGVGERMAHEFEEYRPYKSIKQFRKEIGKYVDEKEVTRYENFVFVPAELNTASEEDFKALPGVGDRIAHEFEEYRPYKSMAQFRKEIGKYVDAKELSRLERLVYLAE